MGDEGDDKGKGGDDKNLGASVKIGDKTFTMADLVKAVRYLGTQQQTFMADTNKAIEGIQTNQDDRRPTDDGDPAGDDKDVDLEGLSRKELASVLGDSLFTRIKTELIDPMTKDLETGRANVTSAAVKVQVGNAEEKYPDFWKWGDEIREVLKTTPSLSVDDAYQLARSRNTEKAATVDAELEKVAVKAAAEKENETQAEFGGLLPTSGRSPTRDNITDATEAAEVAWTEIVEGTPAERVLRGD